MSETLEKILGLIIIANAIYLGFRITKIGLQIVAIKENRKYTTFLKEYFKVKTLWSADRTFMSILMKTLGLIEIKPFNDTVDQYYKIKFRLELLFLINICILPLIIVLIKMRIF